MDRNHLITQLKSHSGSPWDILIIGGGATGMGIALDASSRGYKTLLLEQSDFAKSTSSRSTKLVHGGVRYLAQGDLFLVREALHERGIMLRNAPHLTFNQEFVIPVYTLWDVLLYTVGLTFYDLLAGRLSLGRSHFISRKKTMERLPSIKEKGLKGGIVYHDGQFDDSRMVIALARSAVERGGVVLNYFRVTGVLKDQKGRISGVTATDEVSKEEYNINAGLVVNATGVFADGISKLDDPSSKPTMKPSQGIHLVLNSSFLQSDSAIMIPKTSDGRVLFAIPWYGAVVVGTTDTPVDSVSLEPQALEKEIGFILQTAGLYLKTPPRREDILSIFAGLRPLAANPQNPGSTKEVSRRHRITLSPSGLITIIGGKWTTYRRMAEETIDRAIRTGLLEKRKCETSYLPLVSSVHGDTGDRLSIYGDDRPEIQKIIAAEPSAGVPLHPAFPYTRAEMIRICKKEMPVNLEDILARRTRALFLNARSSIELSAILVQIMAEEMNKDSDWQRAQLEAYKYLAVRYFIEI
jgi:glycerol-3-phosphate dehydrogenase